VSLAYYAASLLFIALAASHLLIGGGLSSLLTFAEQETGFPRRSTSRWKSKSLPPAKIEHWDLGTRLGMVEYRLRPLINRRLGYRDFCSFINDYRVAEAKRALADPMQTDVPIFTIALNAGFQSLAPFNRAFKAATCQTPSDYRWRSHSRTNCEPQ